MKEKTDKKMELSRMIIDNQPLVSIMKFLDNNTIDVNEISAYGDMSERIIHDAALEYSDEGIIDLLISHGANLHVYDDNGESVLHYAMRNLKCPQIIQKLLDLGCSPLEADDDNNHPIHLAAAAGNTSAIRLLLGAGESVNARGYLGQSPLHAVGQGWANNRLETLQFLIACGADIWQKDDSGLLPAAASGDDELIKYYVTTMHGKIKDDDQYISFLEYLKRHGVYGMHSAFLHCKDIIAM